MELKGSKTEQNLMTAFAGESQARNKYTYFASKAKKDGYVQIAKIFEETAENEKEHAKLWFKALGELGTTEENLLHAAEGENAEEKKPLFKKVKSSDEATSKEDALKVFNNMSVEEKFNKIKDSYANDYECRSLAYHIDAVLNGDYEEVEEWD